MRLIINSLLVICFLQACQNGNEFHLSGHYDDSDYIILIDGEKQDSIRVVNGKFNYSGTVDTVHMAYLKTPSSNRKKEFILEPGEIVFDFESDTEYSASGTPTNESYFIYKHGMDSTTAIVMELYQVYLQKETEEEKKQAMRDYNQAEEVRLAFMRKQLRKNPNYTGLMILKPIYRTDSIENLGAYLNHLSAFAYTDIYQEVDRYHNAIAAASPGKPAPNFELSDSTGQMVSLASFRGKYVLLDFWFTGCTYCDMLVPHLKTIYKELNEDGFEIIDISVDKKVEMWKKTMKKKDSPWTHLHDPEKSVAFSYGMPGYPTLIMIDREGKVVKRLVGYRNEDALRAEILAGMQ